MHDSQLHRDAARSSLPKNVILDGLRSLSLSLALSLSLSLSLSFQAELQDRDPYSINPNLYTLNPKPGTWNS